MTLLLTVLTLMAIFALSGLYLKRRNDQEPVNMIEERLAVNSLHRKLNYCGLTVSQMTASKNESGVDITLYQLGSSEGEDHEILGEQYDEYKVVFTPDCFRFFEGLSSEYRFLPEVIRQELDNFRGGSSERTEILSDRRCMILALDARTEESDVLVESDAEAYESWLDLRECSGRLNFIVAQWLSKEDRLATDLNDSKGDAIPSHADHK